MWVLSPGCGGTEGPLTMEGRPPVRGKARQSKGGGDEVGEMTL